MSREFKMDDSYIKAALDRLPHGRRGPKASNLRRSLLSGLRSEVCWPWLGRVGKNGYGIAARPCERTAGTTAHRLVYEVLVGSVPEGWHVDHLCHDPKRCSPGTLCPHRRCVNPRHLLATTARANVPRGGGPSAGNATKTACLRGHEYTPETTYFDPRGGRNCRICRRAYDATRGSRSRQKALCDG